MEVYVNRIMLDDAIETDVKLLIPDAGLRRRMSRVLKTAVSTAVECVGGTEALSGVDAIITATGWGCLSDSERFLRNMVADNEQFLNPTPFIQSTFNTVGGQIALLGHNNCYNLTYVNRSHSFEDALLDAALRIEDGDSADVLLGAFDEMTPSQHRIMSRMGVYRHIEDGEGSMFALLSGNGENALAKLTRIDFPQSALSEEECRDRYASSDEAEVWYNRYETLYPTVSAKVFSKAVEAIAGGRREIIVYNEYFGAKPTVVVIGCI